jgi:hypothetical protein
VVTEDAQGRECRYAGQFVDPSMDLASIECSLSYNCDWRQICIGVYAVPSVRQAQTSERGAVLNASKALRSEAVASFHITSRHLVAALTPTGRAFRLRTWP